MSLKSFVIVLCGLFICGGIYNVYKGVKAYEKDVDTFITIRKQIQSPDDLANIINELTMIATNVGCRVISVKTMPWFGTKIVCVKAEKLVEKESK